MRSALQGWTWTLRGRGAQSTGSASRQPALPEVDSTNSRFMALEGILRISISLKILPFAERLRLLSPAPLLLEIAGRGPGTRIR